MRLRCVNKGVGQSGICKNRFPVAFFLNIFRQKWNKNGHVQRTLYLCRDVDAIKTANWLARTNFHARKCVCSKLIRSQFGVQITKQVKDCRPVSAIVPHIYDVRCVIVAQQTEPRRWSQLRWRDEEYFNLIA